MVANPPASGDVALTYKPPVALTYKPPVALTCLPT